jgi:prephenate dehydrogenase
MFRKALIVGMGVMGGSLGHALARSPQIARKVVALVRRAEVIPKILEKSLAHTVFTDLQSAMEDVELIVVATPVASILKQVENLRPYLKPSMIVTDLGSVKKNIVEGCEKIIGKSAAFVGSHPMAGTEKFGFENFVKNLYRNTSCVVTPTKHTSVKASLKVQKFWQALGCKVLLMSPQEHDKKVAWVSHLPHVLSFALWNTLLAQRSQIPDLFDMSGGSFRDMTRVAGSSPELWTEIFLSNQKHILKTLDTFQKKLSSFQSLMKDKNPEAVFRLLSKASKARNEFSKR